MREGVLLVNLGTPDTPHPKDVKRYLLEFLTDRRVIDLPFIKRHLLVRGLIVPWRYKESARQYQAIWRENGSPLLIYGKKVEAKLQEKLGEKVHVKLAMRYQNPSIEEGLTALKGVKKLTILPLFPQYASASTGSVHEKVLSVLSKWEIIPELRLINSYPDHPALIEAFASCAEEYALENYDHFLFSYHGLPERQIRKADAFGRCLQQKDCCKLNVSCYRAQCLATTLGIINKLQIPEDKWSLSFQSRLGKDPWIKPFTDLRLQELVAEGKMRILVFCPSFVADCLETLEEVKATYQSQFIEWGGETFDLVSGLNDHPKWIEALEKIIHNSPYAK